MSTLPPPSPGMMYMQVPMATMAPRGSSRTPVSTDDEEADVLDWLERMHSSITARKEQGIALRKEHMELRAKHTQTVKELRNALEKIKKLETQNQAYKERVRTATDLNLSYSVAVEKLEDLVERIKAPGAKKSMEDVLAKCNFPQEQEGSEDGVDVEDFEVPENSPGAV